MIINKQYIRQLCLNQRKMLSEMQQKHASIAVCAQIQALKIYCKAQSIALYHAIAGEIDLTPLWHHATEAGKTCYMPTVQADNTLLFIRQTPEEPGYISHFGITEPIFHVDKTITLNHIDLMILPIVAFDTHGTRLGWGAGYYDKTLADADHRPLYLIGAAYAFQQQPTLPREAWDISLDLVVTEKQVIWTTL